jgi:hypothetical protein
MRTQQLSELNGAAYFEWVRMINLAFASQSWWTFGLWAAFICGLPLPVQAEVHVEGSPAAVRITTNRDTISDVLSGIVANFNFAFRTAVPLDSAASTIYSGSLAQVVSRLLDGYTYVIKTDQQKTEIVVLGRRGEVAPRRLELEARSVKGIASRWR